MSNDILGPLLFDSCASIYNEDIDIIHIFSSHCDKPVTMSNDILGPLSFDSCTSTYVTYISSSHCDRPMLISNNNLEPLLFDLCIYEEEEDKLVEGDGKLALTYHVHIAQKQYCNNQEFIHSAYEQLNDDEFDSANETDDFTIKNSAEFP
ncbi:8529_t:CDS:2, partial [Dentiscutata erythropus]